MFSVYDARFTCAKLQFFSAFISLQCMLPRIIEFNRYSILCNLIQFPMKKRWYFLTPYFRYCVYEIFRPSVNEKASANNVEATWREVFVPRIVVLYRYVLFVYWCPRRPFAPCHWLWWLWKVSKKVNISSCRNSSNTGSIAIVCLFLCLVSSLIILPDFPYYLCFVCSCYFLIMPCDIFKCRLHIMQ